MGNAGKVEEREQARALRAQAWTLAEIACELGVARSTVSLWVRDVVFEPRPRNRGNGVTRPHPLHVARLADIAAARDEAEDRIGALSDRELLLAGLTLYAGEGFKTRMVGMANSDPRIMSFFCAWLRRHWPIEEQRVMARLYLHEGLDLRPAVSFWSTVTEIPVERFTAPHRPVDRAGRRSAKHAHGILTVRYCDVRLLRRMLAMVDALLGCSGLPG